MGKALSTYCSTKLRMSSTRWEFSMNGRCAVSSAIKFSYLAHKGMTRN